jgi:hypothetical protein
MGVARCSVHSQSVLGLLLQLLRFLRAARRVFARPEGRALTLLVLVHLAAGTVFYTNVEGWRWLDALYFSVTALTTAGFGDLAPATDPGKVFTMLYLLTGVGVLATFIATIAKESFKARPVETADGDQAA